MTKTNDNISNASSISISTNKPDWRGGEKGECEAGMKVIFISVYSRFSLMY